jgi:hypothetical protein
VLPATVVVVVVVAVTLVVIVVGAAVVPWFVAKGFARTRNGKSTATDTTIAAR